MAQIFRPELRSLPKAMAELSAGDAAHPEGEAHAQQNGNGRPVADTALHKERVERPARASEPTYAVPVTERPVASPEIKVESETKEDGTPPRRGWWQR